MDTISVIDEIEQVLDGEQGTFAQGAEGEFDLDVTFELGGSANGGFYC
ncbi:hypothetical protein PV392_21975 [Streptomyces sp. ME03-5709C]|nr:hypothetical protein [Streptomyces sp. ME03-5709C]